VLVAVGSRTAEEVLLAEVEAALAEGGFEALARPVRVIVPSGSLRLHVAAAVARRRGRAAAGLVVQTLYAAAMEVLERADVAPRVAGAGGDLAFEVLVRRAARRQRPLAERLETLVDGYGAAAASVRDLLDAGFEAAHADAADEALLAAIRGGVPRDEVERARALVAAAVEVERDLAALGAARRSSVLRRATDLLAEDPERLPSRAVFVHGFADATGIATDLLEALVRHRAATVVLDTPPDPVPKAARRPVDAEADAADAVEGGAVVEAGPAVEATHGERLRERLGGAAGIAAAAPPPEPVPAPRVARFSAAGSETEAREVALRARELLDGGARPEGIGIVARDLAPHRLALRRQLAALGVPFSGLGAGGALGTAGRRAQALLELLRCGRELPADRWLDAAGSLGAGGRRRRGPFVDLRLAFSTLGAGRLGDVAAVDLDRALGERDWLPLPILRGLAGGRREEEGEGDDEERREDGARPARRTVRREELALAVAAAGRLVARLDQWPRRAAAGEHLRRLRALVVHELGWRSAGGGAGGVDEASAAPILATLEYLSAELPPGLVLEGDELRLVLGRALEEAGRDPLGGRGGGVQVLAVVEARGRTFDHLFVVGANRNAFPRPVRQDPLLADDLRAALAPVLPDLPRKQAGFDEERYLFAQLLAASPAVTVSWWSRDDDGRAVAPSPLVERLAPAETAEVAATAQSLAAGRGPRPAAESATLAALHGAGRERFRDLLATAIGEGRQEEPPEPPPRPDATVQARSVAERSLDATAPSGDPVPSGGHPAARQPWAPPPPAALAAARVAVLDELDPDLRTREGRAVAAGLGPYFGFVGRRGRPGDPRGSDLWVTHAENLAACPWQLFLERLLRLEPTPDPLQALPGTDALLLGNVVHAVLEEMATAAGLSSGAPLAEALAAGRQAIAVPWPQPAELDRRLLATARRVLAEEGIPLPGLARALAIQARSFLDRAGEIDWGGGERGGGEHGGGEHGAGATLAVLAVEAVGEVAVEDGGGRRRRLAFKADRVDRAGAAGGGLGDPGGAVRLTDYKTGRPLSTAKREQTLRDHHLRRVREGRNLQATAYQLAGEAEAGGAAAVGRYLYLRPDADPRSVEFAVGGDDPAFAERFAATARAAFAAWDAGGFFPRVVDTAGEKEPVRCSFCRVAEACLRGDSGARRRLHGWASEAGEGDGEAERAVLGVWRLADSTGDDEERAGDGGAAVG
jgi:hypothetical protein